MASEHLPEIEGLRPNWMRVRGDDGSASEHLPEIEGLRLDCLFALIYY